MPEIIYGDQNTDEWFKLRLGSIGGSSISSVMAKSKDVYTTIQHFQTSVRIERDETGDFITENEALDIQSWIKDVTSWDKLEILVAEKGTAKDKLGWVAFNVFFHQGDREESMCEYSRFSRLNGRWVYEEGELG